MRSLFILLSEWPRHQLADHHLVKHPVRARAALAVIDDLARLELHDAEALDDHVQDQGGGLRDLLSCQSVEALDDQEGTRDDAALRGLDLAADAVALLLRQRGKADVAVGDG